MTLIVESQTQIAEEEIITQENVQEKLNNDPGYLSTMAMIGETEQSTQNTLDTISETLKKLSATLEGVQKTVNIFGRYQVDFHKAQAQIQKRSEAISVQAKASKEGDNIKDLTQQINSSIKSTIKPSTTKTGSVRSSTNIGSTSTKIAPKNSSTKSSSLNSISPTLKRKI